MGEEVYRGEGGGYNMWGPRWGQQLGGRKDGCVYCFSNRFFD